MKRLITFLFVLLTLLWAVPSYGQASIQRIVRIRDNTGVGMADVLQLQLNFNTNIWGLTTRSGTYFYDATGANWRWWNGIQSALNLTVLPRAPFTLGLPYFYSISSTDLELWRGDPVDSDDIASTTEMPYVGSFGHMWDSIDDNWDRMTGIEITLSAKDMMGLLVYNANMYWDLSLGYFDDWQGDELSSDAVPETQHAPYVGSFLHGWHSDDALWERLRLTDHQDDLALSLHGLVTASVMYGYDGTDLDMLRVDAVGGLVTGRDWTLAGEDAGNDWQKVKKEQTATVSPASEGPTAVAAAATTVLGIAASIEALDEPNWCVYLKNVGGGGGGPLTDADVQVSPDGTEWISLTWTTCDTLTSGNSCSYCVQGNAFRYLRVRATAAAPANDTTVTAWYTGNKD